MNAPASPDPAGRPVRLGILGAARIAPMALVRPARVVDGAEVRAVAARDPARAAAFARRHRIPVVHESYDALLADPELDAIYNPLPNGLHGRWTIRALEAGKHVLCEKPFAANAEEAGHMAEAAARTGQVLVEAFHYRYHALARRMGEVIESGALGAVRHVEADFGVPLLVPGDIRYRWDLAGGATMDTGAYTVNLVRYLGGLQSGTEPVVTGAEARLSSERVDRWMRAELRFPDGVTATMRCSLFSPMLVRIRARVLGESGELVAFNPIVPQLLNVLTVRTPAGTHRERVGGEGTYTCQLRAFIDRVRGGEPLPTEAADAIANMRVIDAVYAAAGLPARRPTPTGG